MNPVCNPVRLIGKRYKAFHYLIWNKKASVFFLYFHCRIIKTGWQLSAGKLKSTKKVYTNIETYCEQKGTNFILLPCITCTKRIMLSIFRKKNSKTLVMIFLLCSRIEKMMEKWRRKNFSLKKAKLENQNCCLVLCT